MAIFEHGEAKLYYEVHGEGFPVLLIAPGGMRSSIPFWYNTPWNPIEQLSPHYQVIAMDQRNAGKSTGPISGCDGWQLFARDQVALLDHLGVDRFHVAGMCIGGPYIMGLIDAVPERVASGVIFQTIGLSDNRQAFLDLFDGWAEELKPAHPDVSADDWAKFRNAMFGGEFLFNVSEDFVRGCATPLLVFMGNDIYHPQESSRRLAELAPNVEFIEQWKEAPHMGPAMASMEAFLTRHT
ncbi:MAG: alpha/beta hydrolase [Pseudomonadota bacterium]